MAISIAMLGFGASGTFLALAPPRPAAAERWFRRAALATAAALIATPVLIDAIALDASQLAWSAGQWIRLGAAYLVLAVPFAAGALVVLLAITLAPDRPGAIYGAGFVGAGGGAAVSIAVLWFLPPDHALAVPAVLASVGAGWTAGAPRRRPVAAALAWSLTAVAVAVAARPLWSLAISPFKALPQVEAYPEARRVAERGSPLGWLVAVEAPAFRYAPGLSLRYRGAFPPQTGLFVDGDLVGAVTRWEGDTSAVALLDWLPSALPYAVGRPQHVLVLAAGGGSEVSSAVTHGATRVTAVELHPDVAGLGRAAGPPAAGDVGSGAEWVVGDARAYVAHAGTAFDLITIGPGGAFAAGAAGVHSLNEDFLHTVEAYVDDLRRLSTDGVLAITRWLTIPPRQSVRTVLTAAEALRRIDPAAVERGLVVARSWGTVTILAKPNGFREDELAVLEAWAADRHLDIDWRPGLAAPVTRYHFLDEPTLFRAAAAAVAGSEPAGRFADAYPFDVRPATDARPYPQHFLRLSSLGAFIRAQRGDWLPFAEWGYVALVATLLQALALAALCMLLPTALRTRGRIRRGLAPLLAYFGALGLAYLAAEIAAIQQLGLLLGHPVYAVAAALAAFLACSGAGSIWSDRQPAAGALITGLALPAVLVLFAVASLPLVHIVQPAPLAVRIVVAIVMLAPPAFLMGVPFPAGLRVLAAGDATRVAWAWAANGFASVVAAPLAALVALEVGSPFLFVLGSLAYGAAGLAQRAGPVGGTAPGPSAARHGAT